MRGADRFRSGKCEILGVLNGRRACRRPVRHKEALGAYGDKKAAVRRTEDSDSVQPFFCAFIWFISARFILS